MIGAEDQRVKDLQQLAWGLQSLTNKPGSRLPSDFKTQCSRMTSAAIALCSDAIYTDEAHFLERAKAFTTAIEAKRKEVDEVEEAEKAKLIGNCYLPDSNGNYKIGKGRKHSASKSVHENHENVPSLRTTSGGARALKSSDVIARCEEDPEVLSLCDLGIGDSDIEPLCQGLKTAGTNLTSLDLSHNLVADVGVQKLVSALATGTCPKLQELYISHNSFGDLGIQMLTSGLTKLRRSLTVHLEIDGSKTRLVEATAPVPAKAVETIPATTVPMDTSNSKTLHLDPVEAVPDLNSMDSMD